MGIHNPFAPKRDPHTGLAYQDGVRAHMAGDPTAAERLAVHERQAEYRRERADQKARLERQADRRRRHGGFGLIGFLVIVAAAVGATWLALAYQAGSFAGGGAVVDRKVAEVTEPARQAAKDAVDRTGQAVQSAGQAVEQQGEKLRQQAQ